MCTSKMSAITDFPADILNDIFNYLEADDLLSFIDISKSFRQFAIEHIKALSIEKHDQLLYQAATYNNVKLLTFLVNLGLIVRSEKLCESSSLIGALNVIQWLYNNRHTKEIIAETIKWERCYGFDNLKVICDNAAFNGQIEVLKWAKLNNHLIVDDIPRYGIGGHQICVIDWLQTNNMLILPSKSLLYSIQSNNTEFIIWLKERDIKFEFDRYDYRHPIINENFEMLICLNSYVQSWGKDTCALAATYGKLSSLKFLRSNGCPWDINTCHNAFRARKYEVLKWAVKNGCPCDTSYLDFISQSAMTTFPDSKIHV